LRANDVLASGVAVTVVTRDADRARSRFPHIFSRKDAYAVEFAPDDPPDQRALGAIDLWVHAAAEVQPPPSRQNVIASYDSIVYGVRGALGVARANGATRFLLMSTGLIYGPALHQMEGIAESYSVAPSLLNGTSEYGNAKRAAEWLTSASASPVFETTIARIFTPIGPGLPLNGRFAAGNFVRDAIAGQPIVISGDVRTLRSYLYTADLAIWLLRILVDGRSGDAYNVGSESPISIGNLAKKIALMTNTRIRAVGDSSSDESSVPRYIPSTLKARGELKLEQYHTLDDALTKTIEWARQQP
jgi:dTDP-glucose 4,6-dehydratase